LFYNQGLWVEQMQAKYQIDEHFLLQNLRKWTLGYGSVFLKIDNGLGKEMRWKVGDGHSINVWLDNWCANESLATLLRVNDYSLINTSLKASHFITKGKEWDIVRLSSLVDPVHLH